MDLFSIRSNYMSGGYDLLNATSKTCQDIILSKLAKCSLSENVTIKGGVVIQNISKDKRRATRDFDLDFIHYSLNDDSIRSFIGILTDVNDGVAIHIVAPIEELSHEDYHGKRVFIELTDNLGYTVGTKLDIGVHNRLNIEQEVCYFEIDSLEESVSLMGNTKEQMFAEKLRSLLKHGRFSTRYKDIFDFYYFIAIDNVDKEKLDECFDEFIYSADDMRENSIADIYRRLNSIFKNEEFLRRVDTAQNNWLELPINDVTNSILSFLKED